MNTRNVKAADLELGHEVIADGHPLGFVVHAIDQDQGRVQVTDTQGQSYTFAPGEALEVRSP